MKIARTHKDAKYPTRKHPTDAGMDFYSLFDYVIKPHTDVVVRTGIAVELPLGSWMLIKPKGGSRWLVGGGVIDYGYTGGILVRVINPYDKDIVIREGEAVAQGIIMQTVIPTQLDIVSLPEIQDKKTERGGTGGIHGTVYEPNGTENVQNGTIDIDGNQSF